MFLFRYFRTHGFKTLETKLLKAARPSEFNDPFESLPSLPSSITIGEARRMVKFRENSDEWYSHFRKQDRSILNRKIYKSWIRNNRHTFAERIQREYPALLAGFLESVPQVVDRHQRVVCFSQPSENQRQEILLWSHYANGHTGIRIGFEVPDNLKGAALLKMDYKEARLDLPIESIYNPRTNPSWALKAMRLKSKAWEYEQEVRLIVKPEACKLLPLGDGNSAHFIPFDPESVSVIDLGIRYSAADTHSMLSLAKAVYPHAVVRAARRHRNDFAIEYQRLN